MRSTTITLSLLALNACADLPADSSTVPIEVGPDSQTVDTQAEEAWAMAEVFVSYQAELGWSDPWSWARELTIEEPIPLWYGATRVGAYEVPVRCDGEDCGFLTVVVDPDRHPVPEYADLGIGPAEGMADLLDVHPDVLREGRELRAVRFSAMDRFLVADADASAIELDERWSIDGDGMAVWSVDEHSVDLAAFRATLIEHDLHQATPDTTEAAEIAALHRALRGDDRVALDTLFGLPKQATLADLILEDDADPGDGVPVPATSNTLGRYPPYYWQIYGWGVSSSCPTGCAPIAWTMLWGWWDAYSSYSNLIGGGYHSYMSTDGSNVTRSTDAKVDGDVANTAYYIGTLMGTSCGGTSWGNIYRGGGYAGTRGYRFTTTSISASYSSIMSQINSVRPVLVVVTFANNKYSSYASGISLTGQSHAMVAYAYIYGGSSSSRYVDVNTGWYASKQMRIVYNTSDFTRREGFKVVP